jgi:hypothetical protein
LLHLGIGLPKPASAETTWEASDGTKATDRAEGAESADATDATELLETATADRPTIPNLGVRLLRQNQREGRCEHKAATFHES